MIDRSIYKDKTYWHLDGHKTIDMVYDYISSDKNIVKHSFYPFIHYEMKFDKFNIKKNNGKKEAKIRHQVDFSLMILRLRRFYRFREQSFQFRNCQIFVVPL